MFHGFVRVVSAIVLAITHKRFVNALGVVALEVVLLTADAAAGGRLVRLVLAVGGAVAVPGLGDANSRCFALKLLIGALIGRSRGAAELVGAVVAIWNSIAFVGFMNALI